MHYAQCALCIALSAGLRSALGHILFKKSGTVFTTLLKIGIIILLLGLITVLAFRP